LLLSDSIRGLIALIVAILAFAGTLEVWHIYAASLVSGFVMAFFEPAYQAIVKELVPMEGRPSAN
jgi:MFS family permease